MRAVSFREGRSLGTICGGLFPKLFFGDESATLSHTVTFLEQHVHVPQNSLEVRMVRKYGLTLKPFMKIGDSVRYMYMYSNKYNMMLYNVL